MSEPAEVAILWPDGSMRSPKDMPCCRRCGVEVSWKHVDEIGELNLELYGILCWDCLYQAQQRTAKEGY